MAIKAKSVDGSDVWTVQCSGCGVRCLGLDTPEKAERFAEVHAGWRKRLNGDWHCWLCVVENMP